MDRSAREAILSIDRDLLELATPEEIALYTRAMDLHLQLLSPLDMAVSISKAKRYKHIEFLNSYLVALMDGRLYFDGPGPEPVHLTEVDYSLGAVGLTEDGEEYLHIDNEDQVDFLKTCEPGLAYDEDGFLILIHPTRGDRPVYNLAISMPPRHGKSYLVSEHLPAWFLATYPMYSVLLASYEASFAAEWGGKVRDHLVGHPEYGIEITQGKNAARSHFELDGYRGFMKCAGAGGPLTGSGGQLIIVDDPIKNAEQAMSAIERDNLDNWWASTLYTRREPWEDGTPGRVILMATRWHEDDLTGRRVPEKPKLGARWSMLNLMALFEPNDEEPEDPLGRRPGAALCPARFPARELREIRDENVQWFEAMYQGHPNLDDGELIKRPFNYYVLDHDDDGAEFYTLINEELGISAVVSGGDCYRYGVLDLAGTDKKHSDYTVLGVIDLHKSEPRYAMLRAVERVKATTENHEELVREWYERWGLRALHIEDKTFGTNLIGRLTGSSGLVIQKLKADTNKVFRALPIEYEVRQGNLWFPAEAEWKRDFEREITKFPKATHDDQVDMLGYGVQVALTIPAYIEPPKPPSTPEEHAAANFKKMAAASRRRFRRGM